MKSVYKRTLAWELDAPSDDEVEAITLAYMDRYHWEGNPRRFRDGALLEYCHNETVRRASNGVWDNVAEELAEWGESYVLVERPEFVPDEYRMLHFASFSSEGYPFKAIDDWRSLYHDDYGESLLFPEISTDNRMALRHLCRGGCPVYTHHETWGDAMERLRHEQPRPGEIEVSFVTGRYCAPDWPGMRWFSLLWAMAPAYGKHVAVEVLTPCGGGPQGDAIC